MLHFFLMRAICREGDAQPQKREIWLPAPRLRGAGRYSFHSARKSSLCIRRNACFPACEFRGWPRRAWETGGAATHPPPWGKATCQSKPGLHCSKAAALIRTRQVRKQGGRGVLQSPPLLSKARATSLWFVWWGRTLWFIINQRGFWLFKKRKRNCGTWKERKLPVNPISTEIKFTRP